MDTITSRDVNKPDEYGEVPLRVAIKCGRLDVCRSLVRQGADVTDVESNCSWTLLHAASSKGSMDIVIFLLKKGATKHINARTNRGDTACHLAARCGFTPVVKILLRAGSNINVKNRKGRNVMEEAIANFQHKTVQYLDGLQCKPVSQSGRTLKRGRTVRILECPSYSQK